MFCLESYIEKERIKVMQITYVVQLSMGIAAQKWGSYSNTYMIPFLDILKF